MTATVTITYQDPDVGTNATVAMDGDEGLQLMIDAFVASIVAAGFAMQTADEIRRAIEGRDD